MSILPRHTVTDAPSLVRWAAKAVRDEFVLYFAGDLATERRRDAHINALADTALLLAETGFLTLAQRRQHLPIEDVSAYSAKRTGAGYLPRLIRAGNLTSFEWRALKALRDRSADISAMRAIRDASTLSSSDADAQAMLDSLIARGLVREADNRGWTLTKDGMEALT